LHLRQRAGRTLLLGLLCFLAFLLLAQLQCSSGPQARQLGISVFEYRQRSPR